MNEQFCLKWNEFNSNASEEFCLLRNEDFLQDVTLVAEDNTQIGAHKLVLSSCSDYFKNIFRNNKHSHPLLCLEGLTSDDIKRLLDYIYDGELKIFQEDLDNFLAMAQRFKLKGLLGDAQSLKPKVASPEFTPPTQTIKPEPTGLSKTNSHSSEVAKSNFDGQRLPLSEDDKRHLDERINQLLEKGEDGKFQCTLCGKFFKTKQQCQYHIEARHLEGILLPCHLCDKTFRSRNSLANHKTKQHK